MAMLARLLQSECTKPLRRTLTKLSVFTAPSRVRSCRFRDFIQLLDASHSNQSVPQCKQIQAQLTVRGIYRKRYLKNKVLAVYASFGSMEEARRVFDSLHTRELFVYTMMVRGYVWNDQYEEALRIYEEMKINGMLPDRLIFPSVAKACAALQSPELAGMIYEDMKKCGLASDLFSCSSMITTLGKCNKLEDARQLFDKMPMRNMVVWNAMINACVQSGHFEDALVYFNKMVKDRDMPDAVTFVSALKACGELGLLHEGKRLHQYAQASRDNGVLKVANSLIDMYCKCGCLEEATNVFDEMPIRDMITWNVMISGYRHNGLDAQALEMYVRMQNEGFGHSLLIMCSLLRACGWLRDAKRGMSIHCFGLKGFKLDGSFGSALVDMYFKCGDNEAAKRVFERLGYRSLVSWNSMICGFSGSGDFSKALRAFQEMQRIVGRENIESDGITYIGVMAAISDPRHGTAVHARVFRTWVNSDVFVANALIDMYSKLGEIKIARRVFDRTPDKNLSCWIAMMESYAAHCLGKDVLTLFDRLLASGLRPNEVVFVKVLKACSNSGLVEEGVYVFKSMVDDHGIDPIDEHFVWMVELLGKAGKLKEAQQVIEKMPLQPTVEMWQRLFSYCKIHNAVEIGENAANNLFRMDPENRSHYTALSDMYARSGNTDGVERLKKEMQDKGWIRKSGCDVLEILSRRSRSIGAG